MLFDNASQFAVLALLLAIGWLFGFASHPGGRKWRARYEAEVAARAQERADLTERARAADARADAAERAAPAAQAAAVPAFGATQRQSQTQGGNAPARRGWFDWRRGDELTRIRGIDAALASRLRGERVDSFGELADLSDQDEVALERRLELPAGTIMRDQWREQARLLADHRTDLHAERFGERFGTT